LSSILIIDDSITVRQGIKLALKKASLFQDFYEARDGRQGLDQLRQHHPDVVLCDVIMPEMDGFTFLEKMKEDPAFIDTPVIMLTGEGLVDKKVRGLDLGASDYLTKPFDFSELLARVKVQLKLKTLQDELKKVNEQLLELSRVDYLTQIFNRRYFMEQFQVEFDRCRRYGQPLSFMIMDIDHFKLVNDTHGHPVGDQVLSDLGKTANGQFAFHDVLARYGGEEFVVLLPMAAPDEANNVAEKLRQAVEQNDFPALPGQRVTISLGVCSYPLPGVDSPDAIISAADEALYLAKETGRNRVVVATVEAPPAA